MLAYDLSRKYFQRAERSIPGGVNSPVRAFKSVGGTPLFFQSAKGAELKDVDGNSYVDAINSWGPMILGYGREEVVDRVKKQLDTAFTFGAPTELEIQVAELLKEMVPGLDLVRMVNSGTEACMSALRLARGYTGKNKFIKFSGNYHGHADPFLISAGSGVATFGLQAVPGVTAGTAQDTLVAQYNDIESVERCIQEYPNQIAAVFLEPVAGNMGCIPPKAGFHQKLRALCDQHNIVLIWDEVMTGFRLAPGGAQEVLEVQADLVTFGKVIGGGMPVGAFGGKKEFMEHISPLGAVYQAGTLSGNPIAMSAGLATLEILHADTTIYARLEKTVAYLAHEIEGILTKKSIPHVVNQFGSMLSVHFTEAGQVTNYQEASGCNHQLFAQFFHHMLRNGVYLPPSSYESWFMCDALGDEEVDKILSAASSFEK